MEIDASRSVSSDLRLSANTCDISNFALSVECHRGISCVMSAIKHAAHTCEQEVVSGRSVRLNFEVEP